MTEICNFEDLADGTATRFVIDDADGDSIPVSVVRIADAVYAIGDICSHANVSLSDGEVWCDELELECPKHSSAFSLVTGQPTTLPATQPVAVFPAKVVDGRVDVSLVPNSGDDR